jgi:leader peptidase (prepilin peptidase)/N-methyltransferase
LRGRCRDCGKAIGLRYLIVELTTAGLFLAIAIRYSATLAVAKWIIFEAILVALFWTDWEERLLPDEMTLGGTAVGLVLACFVAVPGVLGSLLLSHARQIWQSLFNAGLGAVCLAGPVWLLGALYGRLRKREALGLGDVKLLALIGVFLGLESGLQALMMAAIGGSILGLAYILLARKDARSYELPFGSFLCVGAAIIPLIERLGPPSPV